MKFREIPYFVKNYINYEFKRREITVKVFSVKDKTTRVTNMTFKKDGYWHGLEKKIHIDEYILMMINFGYTVQDILLNGVSLKELKPKYIPFEGDKHE